MKRSKRKQYIEIGPKDEHKKDVRYSGTEMHKIVLGLGLTFISGNPEVTTDVSCRHRIGISSKNTVSSETSAVVDGKNENNDDDGVSVSASEPSDLVIDCDAVYYVFNRFNRKKNKMERIAIFAPTSDSNDHANPSNPVFLGRALNAYNKQPEDQKCDVLLIPIAEACKWRCGFKTRHHWVLAEFRPGEKKYRIYDPKNAVLFYRGRMSRFIAPYDVAPMQEVFKESLWLKNKPKMKYTGKQRFFSRDRCGPTVVSMIEESCQEKQDILSSNLEQIGRKIKRIPKLPLRFFRGQGKKMRKNQEPYSKVGEQFLSERLSF